MKLFDPLKIRGIELRNRIIVSPMCQYSAIDGVPTNWHLVHLGSRAVGGAGLVFSEATAVDPRGRISPEDTGIYNEQQIAAWEPITRFIREQGSIAGIQLAHAGRKASTAAPWNGGGPIGIEKNGWSDILGASALPFDNGYSTPREMSAAEIRATTQAFVTGAQNALLAGFQVAEIHAAHGYLLHQFLSPISNQRHDSYGGAFENRIRFLCETTEAVRAVWPMHLPLFVRISATDYIPGAWDLEQSIALAQKLKALGADLIDVSSGGIASSIKIDAGPNYQVPFAEKIRKSANVLVSAVGMITDPAQAERILAEGKADAVMLAREFLRDPYWPRKAANELSEKIVCPKQYLRSW